MQDLVLLGLAVSFLLMAASGVLLTLSYKPRTVSVGERLRRMTQTAAPVVEEAPQDGEDSEPLTERVLKPILERLNALLMRMLPAGMMRAIQGRLDSAGNPGHLTALEFIGIRIAFGLGGVVVAALLVVAMYQNGWGERAALFGFTTAIVFVLMPDTGLGRMVENRRYLIRKALPDVIDLLVVCVEAGIGFDGAVAKTVEKSKGPLAEEFARVIQEMRLGKLRSQALRDMAKRINVMEISAFVAAICQADQTGASLSTTLTAQAQMMRDRRSQRVREQAAKLPIKMLFPLVFCIFPAIFVVLIGPGIIQIMHAFSGV